ncbi:MAG: DASS family sodium-coupled anion symporter [Proteobacteria bacterium]|nr:DASS family sodium-coupled anion symporter [Pseudomonadota bacterium]
MSLDSGTENSSVNNFSKIGGVVGIVLFLVMLQLPAPEGLNAEAWCVAALGSLMAIMWITEAIPLPATALLPIPLVPLLGISSVEETVVSYSHPVIFLCMGGFIVALAMERWKLHQRIALFVLQFSGDRPAFLVGGLLAVSGFLSMWVSNTATTLMMLPIAVSVIGTLEANRGTRFQQDDGLPKALMLSLAYGASIGGMATLVGTPTNAFLAGFVKQTYGIEIGFLDWMAVALPLSLVMLVMAWLLLTKIIFKLGRERTAGISAAIDQQIKAQGKLSRGEYLVAIVFISMATLWTLRPWINAAFPSLALTDTLVAMIVGVLTFLIPVDWKKGLFLMDWEWGKKMPFGILLLFGGGFALASSIEKTGLATWIGQQLGSLEMFPTFVIVLVLVLLLVAITELTSNLATIAAFLPVVGALAITLEEHPLILTIPVTLVVSCAFMLPVATPPNAIVFSAGYLAQKDMTRAGFALNIIAVILIMLAAYTWMLWIFAIEPGVLPSF